MTQHVRQRPTRGFGRLIADRHCRVARATGFALTLGDEAAWRRFAVVARARLAPQERVGLAWGALLALDPHEVRDTAESVLELLEGGAGAPLPPLLGLAPEAEAWAALASPGELAACGAAAFRALGPEAQRRFLASAARHADG
jgi:hypothetical protein